MAISAVDPRQRYYFIDIVRLISMFCIICFHTYSVVYYVEYVNARFYGSVFHSITPLPRFMAFSGLSILGISVFLFGLRWPEKPSLKFLAGLMFAGMLLLLVGQGDEPFRDLVWEWDIYQFLVVCLFLLYFLSSHPLWTRVLGIIGLITTFIPLWPYSDAWNIPILLKHIFFGVCDGGGRGGWALYPNLGFAFFHFALGREVRKNKFRFSRFPVWEAVLWLVLLIPSVPHLGEYIDVTVGPNFYCYIFRKPPLIFWAHYVWILFFLRVALWERWNRFLSTQFWARWISNLEWSRSFGVCYFLHLVWILVVANWSEKLPAGGWQFDVFSLSVIPVVEMMARGVRWLRQKKRL